MKTRTNDISRSDRGRGGKAPPAAGFALLTVLMLVIMTTGLVGTFLMSSLVKVRDVEQRAAEASVFNSAESGLNEAIQTLWRTYRTAKSEVRMATVDALDGKFDEGEPFALPEREIDGNRVNVRVAETRVWSPTAADVRIVARAENTMASQTLVAVIRFSQRPAEVFDNAYFINNYGWLWGAGITVNGSVRSNGDFSLKNPVVNGDVRASENARIGATGKIEGDYRIKDVDWYNTHYGDQVRPTNPTADSEDVNGNGLMDPGEDRNGNGRLDTYEFEDGYTGRSEAYPKLAALEMPYLGDLSTYRNQAIAQGGKITQGGVTIVDAVYGDDNKESGNLLIIGTAENPIEIHGTVVVTNDLVLKGVITGQGTVYAGRNVHIIGDLKYANPPAWPKPVEDMAAVKAANATKDLVGFAAKGSVILGDYTQGGWQSTTRAYLKPPFTVPYEVDPTDSGIGYVSYFDKDGRPMFDGDYSDFDGGLKDGDTPKHGVAKPVSRRYYESSFADEVIAANADNQVQWVDGVLYTNHLVSGKVGAFTLNGAVVSRDEAMLYSGSIDMNYDLRIRYGTYEFLQAFLPSAPSWELLVWKEQ